MVGILCKPVKLILELMVPISVKLICSLRETFPLCQIRGTCFPFQCQYFFMFHIGNRSDMKYSETDALQNVSTGNRNFVLFIALHFRFRADPPGSYFKLQYLQQFPAELADIPE